MIRVSENTEVIKLLDKQIEIEKNAIDIAHELLDTSESPLLRVLIKTTLYDSMKHQEYCTALKEIFTGKELLVRERMEIGKLLEIHDKIEEDMSSNLRLIINKTDHPIAKLLLKEYERDENRHEYIMKQLITRDFRNRPPETILRHIESLESLFGIR